VPEKGRHQQAGEAVTGNTEISKNVLLGVLLAARFERYTTVIRDAHTRQLFASHRVSKELSGISAPSKF
jgi:hypothetical protein